MPTEFEETKLLSKECPDCQDDSLVLGVEIGGGQAIQTDYQIYCSHEEDCGFVGEYRSIEKIYTDNFSSINEAKSEAKEKAYREALKQFKVEY